MAKRKYMKIIDGTAVSVLVVGVIIWGLNGLGMSMINNILGMIPSIILSLTTFGVSVSAVWVGARTLMGKIKFVN